VLIEKKSILAVSRQLIFVGQFILGRRDLGSDAALGGVSLVGIRSSVDRRLRAGWPGLARLLDAPGMPAFRSTASGTDHAQGEISMQIIRKPLGLNLLKVL